MNLATAGNLEGKGREEMALDEERTKGMVAKMLGRAVDSNQTAFQNLNPEEISAKLAAATSDKEKIDIGKEIGFDKEALAVWENWIQGGGKAADVMIKLTQELVSKQHADMAAADALRPERERIIKANKAQQKAIRDTKRLLESEQRVRKEVIKITAEGAKSFLTKVGKIKLDTKIKIGSARAEKATQFGGVISQGRKSLTSAASLNDIVDKDGNPIAGLPNFQGSSLESGIRGTFDTATRGGIGAVSEQKVDQQKSQLDDMIEQIKKNTSSDNIGAQTQIKELQGLKKELENLVGTSGRLDDELKLQTKEITAAAAAQKLVAEQERRLKSFGGPQALLDPSKLNPTLSKIASGGKAMSVAGRAGSTTGFNRGRINQLSGLHDLFGGELPSHLQKEGVARATQVGVSQIGAMNQALGLGMSQEQIRKTAAEQAANLFKGDPQEQNTKALETLNATLKLNNDIQKHGRTDVIKTGGMEDKAGRESVSRQVKFFALMAARRQQDQEKTDEETGIFENLRGKMAKGKAGNLPWYSPDFEKLGIPWIRNKRRSVDLWRRIPADAQPCRWTG